MPHAVLEALDRPGLAPWPLSPRLRAQLHYFGTTAGSPGANELLFDAAEIGQILDDGVLYLVSPLDTANKTEIELTEEQEALLQWLRDHDVRHVRVRD